MTRAAVDPIYTPQDSMDEQVHALAAAPVLLVATDYDGTLSPIVSDPAAARPSRESIVALRSLAQMPNTHVAIISGRSLRDLAEMTQVEGDPIMLVGSHGSEFDQDFAHSLTKEQEELRQRVFDKLTEIASKDKHFHIETKPASIAFHYRNVDEEIGEMGVKEVIDGPALWEGVETKYGKKVIELAVVSTSKGDAIDLLRQRVGASAVIFLGDDVTDEDGFARLAGPDVGVKVGPGATQAGYRVEDTTDVARVLASICEHRSAWLAGSEATPIEEHAILSDGRTLALVTPGARISWLCLPRIDGPAIFADLLGGPAAGHFTVEAADGSAPTSQRYEGDSMVLRTEWGRLSCVDFLDCSGGRTNQRAGRTDLIRIIEGRGKARITFAPRMDFSRQPTRLVVREEGLEIDDSLDPIVLRAPGVKWTIEEEGPHQTAVAEVDISGEPLRIELRYGTGTLRQRESDGFGERQRLTEAYWESWADRLKLPRIEREMVKRSALALKALCYGPTGGIAAAATTSLPEHVGGVRNWDYRFCWPRDASMTAAALVKLGSQDEAMDLLDWLLGVLDKTVSPERLMPLYTCTGHEVSSEGEIGELSGYAGSRPVRIGNAASRQVQLDVFGPITELVYLLSMHEAPLSNLHWRLAEEMVNAVKNRWEEPDHGIWEIRAPRRHHIHSKVMCWLTVDRGIKLSERFLDKEQPEWEKLRDAIKDEVLTKGWNEKVGAFTTAYDFDELDAAALWVGMSGMLDPTDERFVKTVEAVEKVLRDGPTVYRYLVDDGLPGHEGGFFICASWLVESYLLVGRRADAESLFDDLVALVGPTGLVPEQYDPTSKITLGNHPQAYSHLGLIENALKLSQ